MRLTAMAMFGAGYLLGTKAGRERYEEIVAVAKRTSRRLDEYSAHHRPDAEGDEPDRGSRRRKAAV